MQVNTLISSTPRVLNGHLRRSARSCNALAAACGCAVKTTVWHVAADDRYLVYPRLRTYSGNHVERVRTRASASPYLSKQGPWPRPQPEEVPVGFPSEPGRD